MPVQPTLPDVTDELVASHGLSPEEYDQIKKIRARHPNSLLINTGDTIQGSAEALYYAQHNVFTSVGNLAASGAMGNADLLECPTATIKYEAVLANNTFMIPCPNGDPNHGSIDDGLTSW